MNLLKTYDKERELKQLDDLKNVKTEPLAAVL
jgi:hypothetical protein